MANNFTTEAAPSTTREGNWSHIERANAIIRKKVWWAMGASVMLIPFVDVAAVAAIQLAMLNDLSHLYGVTFSQNRAKSIIAALLGSVGATSATAGLRSLVKAIPLVGPLAGVVFSPIVSGGSTYAIGRVFVCHFESGGTFLDFDPEKARKQFADSLREGQKIAEDLKYSALKT